MVIGIDASRAFQKQRTGIEEYSYQVIKHLTDKLNSHQVILYIRKKQKIDFELPANWRIEIIKFPYLWTQVGLSLEMLLHPVDVLFIPAHVVPIFHPKNTVVTVHGLEFEVCPAGYSFWARLYMRWSIKMSCRWAKKIIAVSENTKKDLVKLYELPPSKIEVIYEGVNDVIASEAKQSRSNKDNFTSTRLPRRSEDGAPRNDIMKPYLLFIGRLEKRKNIEGIIEAYKILKEKYNISHKLILAGKPGFGFEAINHKLKAISYKEDIILPGFVTDDEKHNLLANADIFLFPTFYEGFGLPVLEAQIMGVPVVASNNSSIPEIIGQNVETQNFASALIDPKSSQSIAEAAYSLISNQTLKNDIIKKGYENIRRFSWEDCSFRISGFLTDGNK